MSTGYVYENGDLVQIIEYSLDGYQMTYCPNCGNTVMHYLIGYSSTRGPLWMCSVCTHEHPPAKPPRKEVPQ